MIDIREIEEQDRESVGEIVMAATNELRRIYRPVARADSSPPVHEPLFLIAADGSDVVGVVECWPEADSFHIQGLAVRPDRRGQGIARQLIAAAESLAVRARKARVTVRTIRETGNAALFLRLGFVVVEAVLSDRFETPDGDPVTQVSLQRRLG